MTQSVKTAVSTRYRHSDHLPLGRGQSGGTPHEVFVEIKMMLERPRIQRVDFEDMVDPVANAVRAVMLGELAVCVSLADPGNPGH